MLGTEGNKELLSEWKEDVLTEIQMEYEQINLSFDTLDEYQNQVSELLSSVLNDKNKKIFLGTFDSNPKSESTLITNLDSLFNQKMEKDNDFWEIGRMASLSFVDQAWRDHLAEMDHIRTGIGLRAMGQRDPLVEYQKEGYDLFEELVTRVKFSVIRLLFNFEKEILVNNETKKESTNKESVGRNEPCPCGSGKKYKRCHG